MSFKIISTKIQDYTPAELISADTIYNCYKKTFKGSGRLYISDNDYLPVDLAALQLFLLTDKTDNQIYKLEFPDHLDCDDFTFALMGQLHSIRKFADMPFFITWIRSIQHALITFYLDGKIYALEPQTDQIYLAPTKWKLCMICG